MWGSWNLGEIDLGEKSREFTSYFLSPSVSK